MCILTPQNLQLKNCGVLRDHIGTCENIAGQLKLVRSFNNGFGPKLAKMSLDKYKLSLVSRRSVSASHGLAPAGLGGE